ncbi:hypothetical protein TIFTF001_016361 [Ficus carica]|uniref:Uncharacterized protein n=1 Tax=Ficus carica TaxID=3494 RepID=A0AA88A7L5_FICCA|nr:hypothetical protein TIFTF001_016361 [Ficus carica]
MSFNKQEGTCSCTQKRSDTTQDIAREVSTTTAYSIGFVVVLAQEVVLAERKLTVLRLCCRRVVTAGQNTACAKHLSPPSHGKPQSLAPTAHRLGPNPSHRSSQGLRVIVAFQFFLTNNFFSLVFFDLKLVVDRKFVGPCTMLTIVLGPVTEVLGVVFDPEY